MQERLLPVEQVPCASVVACILNGYTDNKVEVELLGGKLFIEYDAEENKVYMTGPATVVFDGTTDSLFV